MVHVNSIPLALLETVRMLDASHRAKIWLKEPGIILSYLYLRKLYYTICNRLGLHWCFVMNPVRIAVRHSTSSHAALVFQVEYFSLVKALAIINLPMAQTLIL